MELYPRCPSCTETVFRPSVDTSTVFGSDPTAAPIDVNSMDETAQPLSPPMLSMRTLTYPDVEDVGPEITGPGAGTAGGRGDGEGGGGGDDFATRSYRFTIFHVLYLIVFAEYEVESSTKAG